MEALMAVAVAVETIPTNDKANDPSLQSLHANESKELGNKGDLLQKEGVSDQRDPLNKETSRSDANELDDPKEEPIWYEDTDYHIRGEYLLPMRRQKAVRRLAQSKDFLDSVESRISYLEKHMKIYQPKENEDEESKKLPPTKCNVATLDWIGFAARVEIDPKSFSTWTHRAELDEEPKNIIEILMEEPRQGIFATNFQDQIKHLPELQILHGTNLSMTADQSEPMNHQTHDLPLKETDDKEAFQYLLELNSVLDKYFDRQIKLYQELSPEVSKVRFDDLWYIFKPGGEVRTPGDTRIQLYRILNVTGGRRILAPSQDRPDNHASEKLKSHGYSDGSFVIECFYFHFDGTRFGPVNVTFLIRRFEGEKSITSLPVYPIDCDAKKGSLREALYTRGKTFIEIANGKSIHRKYNSLTLDKTPEQVDSEVILDFQLAFLQKKDSIPKLGLDNLVSDDKRELQVTLPYGPCSRYGCCGNDYIHNDYEVDEKARATFKEDSQKFLESTEELDKDQTILLPPQVYGFVLRTRRWATFDIDKLEMPDFGTGWEDLVLKPEIKETVLALVENHQRPRDSPSRTHGILSVDLIQGKGRGLIILLHGEPGVGKTSTAECVAAHTKRPLFPITCGDIGDKAEDVERNLEKNFQLAHKWGCVLLLDEADIFLSARSEQDIQRNAIVSVFLRSLEYYSGILFLTTNRVGQMDRAFKSRIHLSLLYPRLDEEGTIKIWENNLKRIEKEFGEHRWTIETEAILKFARKHFRQSDKDKHLSVWNGRQIRNAFQTAIATAAYDAKEQAKSKGERSQPPRLTSDHFKKVAETARSFDRYLMRIADGYSDSALAKQWWLRDDDFHDSKKKRRNKERHTKKRKSKRQEYSSDSDKSDESSDGDSSDSEDFQESEEETGQSDTPPPKKRKKS